MISLKSSARYGRRVLITSIRLLSTPLPARERRTGNPRNPRGPKLGKELLTSASRAHRKRADPVGMALASLELHACTEMMISNQDMSLQYGNLSDDGLASHILYLEEHYLEAFALAREQLNQSSATDGAPPAKPVVAEQEVKANPVATEPEPVSMSGLLDVFRPSGH